MSQRILKILDYGGLLDETFDLYKNNFLLLIGISAVVFVPYYMLPYLIRSDNDSAIFLSMLYMPLNSIAGAATTYAVSRRYLGQEATILSSFSFLKNRFWSFAGTMVLTSAITSLGFMLLVIPGILFSLWYIFVSQVFVLEGLSSADARGRSKDLAQYDIKKILLVSILAWLIMYLISSLFSYLSTLIPNAGSSVGIIGDIPFIFTTPVYVTVIVLLYYDMRVRYEGFDIEMLAKSINKTEEELSQSI